MSIRKTLARTTLGSFAPPITTRDLRRAALASAGPRDIQGSPRVREPVLSYAASGLLAAIAGILLGRRLLRWRHG